MKPSQQPPPPLSPPSLEFIFTIALLLTLLGNILYFAWITCFCTLSIYYLLESKSHVRLDSFIFLISELVNKGVQICELSLPKCGSFKLLWKTSTVILHECFSTRGDSGMSGSIWKHFWLSQRERGKILVSTGKRPGMLQSIQQCTQEQPTPTQKSIVLRSENLD